VFTYVYSRYALCLLLQILFVAALDIKLRNVPTVSSMNSLLLLYCKTSLFFANFYVHGGGGAPTVRFAPVVPWAKTGPDYTDHTRYATSVPARWHNSQHISYILQSVIAFGPDSHLLFTRRNLYTCYQLYYVTVWTPSSKLNALMRLVWSCLTLANKSE
jgi:hypothetical protein